jgi:hypothetical protein
MMRILIGNNEIDFPQELDDLIRMKAQINNDIVNIKNQIAKKKLDGELIPEWVYKAKSSIRYKKVMLKTLEDLIRTSYEED